MPLANLIAAHKAAWDRLGRACDRADDVRARQEGRAVTPADRREWINAECAEAGMLGALVAYVPTDPDELRQWADYLHAHVERNGVGAPDITATMLRTLSQFRPLAA